MTQRAVKPQKLKDQTSLLKPTNLSISDIFKTLPITKPTRTAYTNALIRVAKVANVSD